MKQCARHDFAVIARALGGADARRGGLAVPLPETRRARPQQAGEWIGSEEEGGERRYVTTTFPSGSGTVAYEGIVTLTVLC